jgi:signal transduction histidine kinase
MGLGLSLSYGILSKLQGSIVVESELGKGAAFVIRIPKDFRELA